MTRSSFASIFVSTAVVTALLVSLSAADVCEKSRTGAPCEIDGKPSRCWNYTCRALPKPCPSGSKELQSCDKRFGTCTQFTDKKQLHCVNSTEIPFYKDYDACDGKTDGATCTPMNTGGWPTGTTALFVEKPGQCRGHFCDPESFSRCHDKSVGTACEFEYVYHGFLYQASGACAQSKLAKFPLLFCNASSNVHMPALSPVAPVQVYDNRPNVSDPTNVQTADLCNIFPAGTPCTHHASGSTSRCSNDNCAGPQVVCPKGAKPMDKCELTRDGLTGYCFEYLVEGQLSCVHPIDVRAALKFDSCVGKKDGDSCDDLDFSYNKGAVTFYQLPKGKCHRQVCESDDTQACEFSNQRDACSADVLYKDKIVTVKTTCDYRDGYLICYDHEGDAYPNAKVVGPAPVIPTEKLVVKAVEPTKLEPTPSGGKSSDGKPRGSKTSAATQQTVAVGSALLLALSAVSAM